MTMFDAVLFDLDGTLINSAPDVGAAVNRLLDTEGRRPLAGHELRTMIGFGAEDMLSMAFAATGDSLADEDSVHDAVKRYRGFYKKSPAELTTVYPGVREVLAELAETGVKLGICSNKPHELVELVLTELGMVRIFNAITGGDNVPHRKPDGRHIHLTLEMMGAAGMSAAMVGDSETDVAASRNAGLPVVAVDYGYSHGPAGELDADALIGHFADLPATLGRLACQAKSGATP